MNDGSCPRIYDIWGSRLEKHDAAVGVTAYTYNADDQIETEDGPDGYTEYAYNDNGSTIAKTTYDQQGGAVTEDVSYDYNYENRLASATTAKGGGTSTVAYFYDQDGLRVQSVANGTDVTNYLVDKNRAYGQVLEEPLREIGLRYPCFPALEAVFTPEKGLLTYIPHSQKSHFW